MGQARHDTVDNNKLTNNLGAISVDCVEKRRLATDIYGILHVSQVSTKRLCHSPEKKPYRRLMTAAFV